MAGSDLVANLPARDVAPPQEGQAVPAGGSAGGVDPATLQQLQQLMKQSGQPHRDIAPPPVSPKFNAGKLSTNIGMAAINMFVPFIGGAVQKAVKAERETQIVEVMNKLGVINQELEMAQYVSQGDPKKTEEYLNKSPRLSALFNGPEGKKFRKGMMKVFGTDLLNPEKQNTVYHEAMKRQVGVAGAVNKIKELFANKPQPQQGGGQGQSAQAQGQQGGQAQQQQAQPQAPPPSNSQQVMGMPQKINPPDVRGVQEMATAVHATIEAIQAQEPKTDQQMWYRAFKKENDGRDPSSAEVKAHRDQWRLRPVDQMAMDAYDEFQQTGDADAFEQKLGVVHKLANAMKATPRKNALDMLYGTLAGNKEDAAAYGKWFHDQIAMREAYGRGRAMYQFHNYVGPDGQQHWYDALTVRNMMLHGENPGVPIGQMSPKDVGSLQRIQQDLAPKGSPFFAKGAFKRAYDNLATFDKAGDRAIFAQIMRDNREQLKLGIIQAPEFVENIIDQALTKNLSPEGRQYAVVARRIAEGLGAVRNVYNLPSTNTSMQLLTALIPGAATPDSDMARKALDELGYTVQFSYSLPVYQGAAGAAPKKQSLGDYINSLKKKPGAK